MLEKGKHERYGQATQCKCLQCAEQAKGKKNTI